MEKRDTGPRRGEGQLAIPETIAEEPFEGVWSASHLKWKYSTQIVPLFFFVPTFNLNCIFAFIFTLN